MAIPTNPVLLHLDANRLPFKFAGNDSTRGRQTWIPADMEALKARKLLADIEDRELRLSVRKKEYVPLEQVRLEWTTQVGKARAIFEARFLNELPPVLVGKDAIAIRQELDRVLIEVYQTLHNGGDCTP